MPKLMRTVAAVVSGSLVAFLAVVIAPVVVMFAAGQFPASYLSAHADLLMGLISTIGAIVVAILAGAAVGLLAPDRPLLHALATAAVLVGITPAHADPAAREGSAPAARRRSSAPSRSAPA